MLTTSELISSIQDEIGESSAEAMDLIGHLTSAESCETLDDLRQHLAEARLTALAILQNIHDQQSRLPAPPEQVIRKTLTAEDKRTAEHLQSRVRIYDELIEQADQECNFAEVTRLTAEQDRIRGEWRALIF